MTVAGSRRAGPPNQCRVEIMVRDFVSRMLIATVYQDAEKGWNGSFRGGGVAHEPGIHMWTAPVSQGARQLEGAWSVAVICPAYVVRSHDRWPRWVARIGSQTRT